MEFLNQRRKKIKEEKKKKKKKKKKNIKIFTKKIKRNQT